MCYPSWIGSEKLAEGVDCQTYQGSDHRAVDADELEVSAYVEFYAGGCLAAVPAFDGVGDDGDDLGAVGADHVADCFGGSGVDLVDQGLVGL